MNEMLMLIPVAMIASTFAPRMYWKWRFNQLNDVEKMLCEIQGVDYSSLIRRGLL